MKKEVAEVPGSQRVGGQRCPVKQVTFCPCGGEREAAGFRS